MGSDCNDVFSLVEALRFLEIKPAEVCVLLAAFEKKMPAACCASVLFNVSISTCACVYIVWRLECTNHNVVEKFWDGLVRGPTQMCTLFPECTLV